jgi:hypothetical protein
MPTIIRLIVLEVIYISKLSEMPKNFMIKNCNIKAINNWNIDRKDI